MVGKRKVPPVSPVKKDEQRHGVQKEWETAVRWRYLLLSVPKREIRTGEKIP